MNPFTVLVLRRSLAPVALMALIYWLSAQPDLTTGLGVWDLVLRKLAHITEYGLLTVLWFRALSPLMSQAGWLAAGISLLYAISDEYHQSFVAGRSASPIDVGIDLVGVAIALGLLALIATTARPWARR